MLSHAALMLLAQEGLIDDEELITLLLSPNPTTALRLTDRLDISAITDEAFVFLFRFDRTAVMRMVELLPLPPTIRLSNGSVLPAVDAVCIMLRRYAYPGRCGDLQALFGRQRSEISMIFNTMVRFMYTHLNKALRITTATMPYEQLQRLATAVASRGSPLKNCVGFVDGTVRAIARPTVNQRDFYNGHKRKHAVKYQGVMAADGMFVDLYGPVVGRRHDMYLFQKSGLMDRLNETLVHGDETFCLYGDPAYVLRPTLQVGFKGSSVTESQAIFNAAMSSVRVSVEWGFGNVVNLWAFLDMKRSQKVGMSPVGMYYPVGVLLANLLNCTRPNQVALFFSVKPPTLDEYIRTGLAAEAINR